MYGTSIPTPSGSLKNTTVIVATWLNPEVLVGLDIEVAGISADTWQMGKVVRTFQDWFTERY